MFPEPMESFHSSLIIKTYWMEREVLLTTLFPSPIIPELLLPKSVASPVKLPRIILLKRREKMFDSKKDDGTIAVRSLNIIGI